MGIYSPSLDWSFSLRLPDYTSVFQAELLAIVLALRKLPLHITKAVIVTDSLSVCSALNASTNSTALNTFYTLAPPHLRLVHLVWVPGHRDIHLNEIADALARASLKGPVTSVLPETAHITAARYRQFSLTEDKKSLALEKSTDFIHLNYSWNRQWCPNRQFEVTFTRLRCRIPQLNFYLHRCGLAASPLCYLCNEPESIDHFLLSCRRFSNQRQRCLEIPLRNLGLPLCSSVLLSLGATVLGYSHGNVCRAMYNFLCDTKRLPH